MILYHGSNLIVDKPRIIKPNRFLDFGIGFYTTSNKEQAINFARKVTARKEEGISTVSIYNFDETQIINLKVLSFDLPDEKWLDFVFNNRNGIYDKTNYDLIYGPVANDDVFRTFSLYQSGILTKEQTLESLKVKKLFNQYVFTSDLGLSYLSFIKSEGLENEQ